MALISITEKENSNNLLYIQSVLGEMFSQSESKVNIRHFAKREKLTIELSDKYYDIINMEIWDKVSEIIAIKYKYDFFKRKINLEGLNTLEKEIMYASLIAADLEEDKRYTFNKIKGTENLAIDGIFNFRLRELKNKWEEIITYMPEIFMNTQMKDFILFLLENKKKKVYIDGEKVYDSHYRRLRRSSLLDGDKGLIIREVLLSNCGSVELNGKLPEDDEFYLKEFYNDKIIFSKSFFD